MTVFASIQRFDYALSSLCLCHRFSNVMASCCRYISRSGDGPLYIAIGLYVLRTDLLYGKSFLMLGLMAFAIELPIYVILKNVFRRQRPTSLPSYIEPSDRYSLPSGHTAAAFMMATLISHFYPSLALLVWVWAGLIGVSRILLGVHFFTDIVAGAWLGLSVMDLVITLAG
ncbi:phosphatase PAP2 family protein [Thaumasiovibrio sp. DFM-14]|uniref:phosphatase PAP2 family protein n=1 Tax=Thaumasiovibrio sp. DFM-14 TaxID=3384792 RepID=UPI0039A2913F